jgi:hypothetical protein
MNDSDIRHFCFVFVPWLGCALFEVVANGPGLDYSE